MHEADTFPECHFVTLTISDQYREARGHTSLDKTELQKFFKRLRKQYQGYNPIYCPFEEKIKRPIRYFACGEYGDQSGREHYHACIFNIQLTDLELYKITEAGHRLYTSERLQSVWTCPDTKIPMGHVIIGSVTFDSAAYCARYMLKKQKGRNKKENCREDGEYLEPEFVTMSRRPGLGAYWFHEYKTDVYPNDFIIVKGKKTNVPRTYDEYLKKLDEKEFEEIKQQREIDALEHIDNNTPERLKVREAVAKAQQARLTRPL
jgi:hypothetical protein